MDSQRDFLLSRLQGIDDRTVICFGKDLQIKHTRTWMAVIDDLTTNAGLSSLEIVLKR